MNSDKKAVTIEQSMTDIINNKTDYHPFFRWATKVKLNSIKKEFGENGAGVLSERELKLMDASERAGKKIGATVSMPIAFVTGVLSTLILSGIVLSEIETDNAAEPMKSAKQEIVTGAPQPASAPKDTLKLNP